MSCKQADIASPTARFPDVSIVLPFRNAAETLPACVDSIQRQTLDEYELLAINDGSEEDSAGIVADRARSDPRIRLLDPGRVGLVARMDADDLMHPDRLRLQRDFLRQHPEIALVATQVRLPLLAGGVRSAARHLSCCGPTGARRR